MRFEYNNSNLKKRGAKMKPFVPMKLPLTDEMISYADVLQAVSEASQKIGAFNEKLKTGRLFQTHALKHLLKLESLYSTRIEGTQTTIEEVYKSETEEKKNTADTEEVHRYSEALLCGITAIEDAPISNKLLKELHYILLQGNVRKNSKFSPGEFRTQQNRVGEHVPPIATDVENLMGNLERYINNDYGVEDEKLPPLLKAALIHAQFETIHPFPDGNGRVGRVLIPLYLFKQDVIKSPHFFISHELERQKMKYYSYLQGTRTKTKEGFTDWFLFFLDAVKKQCDRDISFIDDIEKLYATVLRRAQQIKNSTKTEALINAIFKFPVCSCDTLYIDTGINKNTIRQYLKVFCDLKILFSDQKQRNKRYYFMELIDILQ